MRIACEPTTREAELRGTPTELRRVAAHLRGARGLLGVGPAERTPGAYSVPLEGVRVLRSEGLARIRVEGTALLIEGNEPSLETLAENLEGLADHPEWNHLHLEPYPGHPYLAAESLALVARCAPSARDG